MMNPFDKIPFDMYIYVSDETNRRIDEFYDKNTELLRKLTLDEKEQLKLWIYTTVLYEYYRMYNLTEEEVLEYNSANHVQIDDSLPTYRLLITE